MRIDKFISRALAISRKDARDIIKSKRVKIGSRVALKNDWEVNCEDVFLDHDAAIYITPLTLFAVILSVK